MDKSKVKSATFLAHPVVALRRLWLL